MATIKFMKHYVTDGQNKVKVSYHHTTADQARDGKERVTIYSKNYKRFALSIVHAAGLEVINESDTMTDYFEHDRVNVYSDHPRFAEVLARCN